MSPSSLMKKSGNKAFNRHMVGLGMSPSSLMKKSGNKAFNRHMVGLL